MVTTEKVQETDKKVPITTVASTTKKVVKPAKVKLSKIQNVKKKSVNVSSGT